MENQRWRMVGDPARVHAFFNSIEPYPLRVDMRAIGLERDGQLVAAVLYDSFNGHNICMSVAAAPGRQWMTREFLRYAFHYPFVELGAKRITGIVRETNLDARRFDEHLGFTEECRMRGAAEDGSDVIAYVMWRHQCRFLTERTQES